MNPADQSDQTDQTDQTDQSRGKCKTATKRRWTDAHTLWHNWK